MEKFIPWLNLILIFALPIYLSLAKPKYYEVGSIFSAITRSGLYVLLGYAYIINWQYLIGSLRYVSDGELTLGVPSTFYSDSIWVENPTIRDGAISENIFMLFFFWFLLSFIKVYRYKKHGNGQ